MRRRCAGGTSNAQLHRDAAWTGGMLCVWSRWHQAELKQADSGEEGPQGCLPLASTHPSIHPFIHPPIHPSVHPSINLCTCILALLAPLLPAARVSRPPQHLRILALPACRLETASTDIGFLRMAGCGQGGPGVRECPPRRP